MRTTDQGTNNYQSGSGHLIRFVLLLSIFKGIKQIELYLVREPFIFKALNIGQTIIVIFK